MRGVLIMAIVLGIVAGVGGRLALRSSTERPAGPTTTPTGVAIFSQDFQSIRKFADRDHANIVSWNRYPSGSHFATRDATELLVSDIRSFYRRLR